jgi:hypothetical protein
LYRKPNTYSYKRDVLPKGTLDRIEVLVLGRRSRCSGSTPAHFSRPGFQPGKRLAAAVLRQSLTLKYLDGCHG